MRDRAILDELNDLGMTRVALEQYSLVLDGAAVLLEDLRGPGEFDGGPKLVIREVVRAFWPRWLDGVVLGFLVFDAVAHVLGDLGVDEGVLLAAEEDDGGLVGAGLVVGYQCDVLGMSCLKPQSRQLVCVVMLMVRCDWVQVGSSWGAREMIWGTQFSKPGGTLRKTLINSKFGSSIMLWYSAQSWVAVGGASSSWFSAGRAERRSLIRAACCSVMISAAVIWVVSDLRRTGSHGVVQCAYCVISSFSSSCVMRSRRVRTAVSHSCMFLRTSVLKSSSVIAA